MKMLQLSKLTIDQDKILAVEEDLEMADGHKTTVIHINIPNVAPFQLYSSSPSYERDKAKLIAAIVNHQGEQG